MTLAELGLVGVKQTILGRGPDFGEPPGNCMQAAIATVLGLPLDAVPHFLSDGTSSDWWDRMNDWLLARAGVALLGLGAGGWAVPPVLHLMQGRTVRESHHVVVGFGGQIVWDPHPSNDGLSEVLHHELFVAARPTHRRLAFHPDAFRLALAPLGGHS